MNAARLVAGYVVVAVAFFLLGRLTASDTSRAPKPGTSKVRMGQVAKMGPSTEKVSAPKSPSPSPYGVADDPSPSMGPRDAPVIVVEVLDFQCPVCRRAYFPMKKLVQDLPGKVRLVFKHNPLKMHRHALDAAVAAMAAARQGKFWEYADVLFQNQSALSPQDLEAYAQRVGLDIQSFRKDFKNRALRVRALTEGRAASQLGARGTPSFFVNGKMQVGWASYPSIVQQVRREVQLVEALMRRGVPLKEARKQRIQQSLGDGAGTFLASALALEYSEP